MAASRELTDRIQGVLETEFVDVWVEGEISNLKLASSGHWYFSLKDDKAQIRAVVWRNDARLIRFKPQDGMKVRGARAASASTRRGGTTRSPSRCWSRWARARCSRRSRS